MNELHLFAGAGGGILGGQLLGNRCVCAVEREPYAQAVLVARQNDGTFQPFPIWNDVCTFDGNPWRGVVDVVCGGFPCQDISVAGNGAGLDGERSGLWSEMARIIGEVQPRYAFIENSPALVTRGLDRVLSDLAALGFDARWGVVSAADVGAFHKRERIWILANARSGRRGESGIRKVEQQRRTEAIGASDAAYANSDAWSQRLELSMQRGRQEEAEQTCMGGCGNVSDADERQRNGTNDSVCARRNAIDDGRPGKDLPDSDSDSDSLQRMVAKPQPSKYGRPTGLHSGTGIFPAWPTDPADAPQSGLGRVVDGMANRSHRIKAIGNGQVSRVAAAAFALLHE